MPDPTGLQYMPGGKLYGLNSPFITSNNPPQADTTNKLGYLGLSGTNSATYTPPPAGTATVDNPGVFVPSQPLVEHQGTRQAANADGTFNWLATAPGNVGTTAASHGINGTVDPYNLSRTTQGATTGTANSSINGSFDPFNLSRKITGKAPYQQSTGMPQVDPGTLTQGGDGLNYSNAQDQVANALFDQHQSIFSPYRPQGSGFFRSRF